MSPSRRNRLSASLVLAIVAWMGYERLAFSQDKEGEQPRPARDEITLANGRITMHVANRSLVAILDNLSTRQTDVTILLIDRAAVDRPVTVTFQATPFDAALRALLDEEDVVMLYGGQGRARSVLMAVLIYPKGRADSLVAAVRQDADMTAQLAHALDSPDEEQRARAVQTAIDRAGTQAEDVVLRALDDQSDHVRAVALSSALEAAFALPVDTLIRLATADPAPSVRWHAMQALGSNLEGVDARQRLSAIEEVAGRDPDPSVRKEAAGLLERLASETPPSDEGVPPEE
jgi:hypothetical protein